MARVIRMEVEALIISIVGAPHRPAPAPVKRLPSGRVPMAKVRMPDTLPRISTDDHLSNRDMIRVIVIP